MTVVAPAPSLCSGLLLAALVPVAAGISCLVVRPGYGLVPEQCAEGSVGCRIRISEEAVDFYEFSPLYDRDVFVCVHASEFDGAKQSGCLRKRNGRVRCWCHGRSNCNTAEDSKRLYEAFVSEDVDRFEQTIDEIDSSPEVTDFSDPTELTPTTTHAPEIVKVPIVSKHSGVRGGSGIRGGAGAGAGTQASSNSLRITGDGASGFARGANSHRRRNETSAQKGQLRDFHKEQAFSKSAGSGGGKPDDKHKHRHHHKKIVVDGKQHVGGVGKGGHARSDQKSTSVVNKMMFVHNTPSTVIDTTTVAEPKPVARVHLDQNNEVHVVRVGVHDRYDHVLGSEEVQRVLHTTVPPLPTDTTSEDLYDEEELARLDAEFAEAQRRQNRPKPTAREPVHLLPQEEEDVGETLGEYFDSHASSAHASMLAWAVVLLLPLQLLP